MIGYLIVFILFGAGVAWCIRDTVRRAYRRPACQIARRTHPAYRPREDR